MSFSEDSMWRVECSQKDSFSFPSQHVVLVGKNKDLKILLLLLLLLLLGNF